MREAEIRERVSLEHQTTIDAMRAQLKEVERDREENMRKSAFIQRLQVRAQHTQSRQRTGERSARRESKQHAGKSSAH